MTDHTLDQNQLQPLSIAERIAAVRVRMVEACAAAGRSIDMVTLIAVSKTHPPAPILEAVGAGVRDFGENRIEELDKIAIVTAGAAVAESIPLTWHMIGHVQSRKARDILANYDWVHSLDSVKLAERFARFLTENGQARPLNALLEINISGEASKEGFVANKWRTDSDQRATLWESVRQIVALRKSGLIVRGLMTVAPIVDDPEQARPVFAGLRALRDALAVDFPEGDWRTLSMGMTDDYAVAIEEGATLIRVGRAIFGARFV